ncbi:hypothetical protein LIER_18092 [Lithospermum erythrorhizon]|uniref:Uncharacterized protein n=1 Tax=Lithospermum erythrorhizon TaxID=34254 RepID=A0AAV3QDR8_LITER
MGYRTTHRTPTQVTPYVLVYEVEAVFPLEVEIPSLRVVVNEGFTQEKTMKFRLQELNSLGEQRLQAQQRLQCYQSRISKSYNKKVRQRSYQVGDMMLAIRRPIHTLRKNAKNADQEGLRVGSINGRYLKKYYP